jgi:hypothetical protein
MKLYCAGPPNQQINFSLFLLFPHFSLSWQLECLSQTITGL